MRDFFIQGAFTVQVAGGAHCSGPLLSGGGGLAPSGMGSVAELGMPLGPVHVVPNIVHADLRVDDYGPSIPANEQALMGDVQLIMTLIDVDTDILAVCAQEAAGGWFPTGQGPIFGNTRSGRTVGLLAGGGKLLGNGWPRLFSGNHYVGVNLVPQGASIPVVNSGDTGYNSGVPWRFLTCHLEGQQQVPLGVDVTAWQLRWRCPPYAPIFASGQTVPSGGAGLEPVSSGRLLWDHTLDGIWQKFSGAP